MAENNDQGYYASYYRVLTLRGASVYVSLYALLLIALFVVSALLKQSFSLALIASIALISIVHEAGHVVAAAALRLKVHSVHYLPGPFFIFQWRKQSEKTVDVSLLELAKECTRWHAPPALRRNRNVRW